MGLVSFVSQKNSAIMTMIAVTTVASCLFALSPWIFEEEVACALFGCAFVAEILLLCLSGQKEEFWHSCLFWFATSVVVFAASLAFWISKRVKSAKAEREYDLHGGLMPIAAQAIREANAGFLPGAWLHELKKENQKKFRKSPRSIAAKKALHKEHLNLAKAIKGNED